MNDKARYTSDQCLGWPIQALFWLEWATTLPQAPDVIRSSQLALRIAWAMTRQQTEGCPSIRKKALSRAKIS